MNATGIHCRGASAPATAFAIVSLMFASGLLVTGCAPSVHEKPVAVELPVETNSIGMKMVLVPAGEFMMGSGDGEADEKPPHRVRIAKPFYLGQHEVTSGQFRRFREEAEYGYRGRKEAGPSFRTYTDEYPEVRANWSNAVAFCEWLSKKETKHYRLPTEAEWEYACRAGTKTQFSFGDNARRLDEHAWFIGNSKDRVFQGQPHPVGQKKPNAWGFYDMHGNVAEWCADWYDPTYYGNSPADDPQGPPSGAEHVTRGGSWRYNESFARSTARMSYAAASGGDVGFRVARDP